MNWGRKKTSASSAPERGVKSITKMFPVSWFSRLRQGHGNENRSLRKVKKDVGLQEDRSCRVEKFYGETEEHFWRLSFEDEGVQGRKCRRGCPGSVSYGWHDDIELSPSACRSCGAKDNIEVGKNERMDFSHMVLDLKKTRDTNRHVQAERETNGQITRGDRNSKVLRRAGKLENLDLHQLRYGPSRVVNYASLKGADRKMVGEKEVLGDPNIQNSTVKDIMEVAAVKPIQTSIRISRRSQSSSTSQKHHHEASTHSKLQGSECENFGKINFAETGEERKSIYIGKDSQKRRSKSGRSSKAKIYSPRTPSKAELCKIRALEDLKKTRMKTRAKGKEEKEKTLLESFAVVKCSFDPQKDFRNSMLEMIIDKGISKPEELEELLVCYLILNSDEYHDMIIKSFRQVWFDLNKDRLNPPLRDGERCNN